MTPKRVVDFMGLLIYFYVLHKKVGRWVWVLDLYTLFSDSFYTSRITQLGNFVILGEEKVGKTFIFIVWDSSRIPKIELRISLMNNKKLK